MNVKYEPNVCDTSYLLVQVSPHVALFILRRATVCFQNLLSGLILYPQSLDSKATQTGTAAALCSSASSCSHIPKPPPPKKTPNNMYIAHASENAAAPPTHLAASAALRGVKQTVIDLRRNCLFCLGADDG